MTHSLKTGAIALTLVTLMAGCAPVPNVNEPAVATTGGYAPYGTTPAATDYGYNTTTTVPPVNTTANTSYYDYGAGAASAGTSYGSAPAASTSYYDYSAPATSAGSTYTANNTAGGTYAVQVVASPNRGTAEAMRSQMQYAGFNAVIDQVGGYYKVRVPFSSESEAKANLSRIRSSVPDAFYTTR